MRVLLIGEFSSFHRNLKIGLEKIGVKAVVAGSHDGFKNLPVDILLFKTSGVFFIKYLLKVLKFFIIRINLKKLKGYDIVQFINPYLFSNKIPYLGISLNKFFYKTIIKNNNGCFLACCGSDAILAQIGKYHMDYCSEDSQLMDNSMTYLNTVSYMNWNINLIKMVDGIIPSGYEYELGYKRLIGSGDKLTKVIPMPIVVEDFLYEENLVNGPIKIFHGISRVGFKGSNLILKALEIIKSRFNDKVEITIVNRLSYSDYVSQLKQANIVIDQVFSYGYGLNALISLSLGKVTLGGAEKEALSSMGLEDCPVVNIKPDVEDIVNKLTNLINAPSSLQDIGAKSRLFVEKHHESSIVAAKYLEAWKSYF
ncbi:MAG: hypothetical protein AB7S48_11290 [Bacteroidales bacterium]